jgi:TPR repeat protein
MSLMTIPNVAQRSLGRGSKRSLNTRSSMNFSQYATFAELLPEDMGVALSLLPLPLYEIAVCFQQGWGVGRSLPASAYYFDMAAKLGDPDAMYEMGYCYLNGTGVHKDKAKAAYWLRNADVGGKRVIGESWIFKEKWGGDQA